MLNMAKIIALLKGYGICDFEVCHPNKSVSFLSKDGFVIVQIKDDFTVYTVWDNDECMEVLANHQINSLDELYVCLDNHAK